MNLYNLSFIFFLPGSYVVCTTDSAVVVLGLPLTQFFSLPSSAGVRGPAAFRGQVTSVEAPVGEEEEQRDCGSK